MTNEHVIRTINSITTKSCEGDPIFKKVAPFITDEITAIINISLIKGVFANHQRNAIVCPLLKKAGLAHILKNYRPVSNLPFLSKWLKSACLNNWPSIATFKTICLIINWHTGLTTAVTLHLLNWPVTFLMPWSIKRQWYWLYLTLV